MIFDSKNAEFVLQVINEANNKVDEILAEAAMRFEEEEPDFSFEDTRKIIMCRMFESMMNIADGINDLTSTITLGAVDELQEKLGLSDEEILDMEDDKMEEALKPYLDLQHIYADFNNNQLKEMLFETAKNILSDAELMMIWLGC